MRAGRAPALWLVVAGACAVPAPALALQAAAVLPTTAQIPGYTRHHVGARRWQRVRTATFAQAQYRRGRVRIVVRLAVARSAGGVAQLLRAARRGAAAVRSGRLVGQVAVSGPGPAAIARGVARLIGQRARILASRTPWENFVAQAESDGHISAAEAVRAFSSAITPLPGVHTKPVGGPIPDGTQAIRWLLATYARIPPRQRTAALKALAGGPTARTANFVPSLQYQQIADIEATAIRLRLGIPLAYPLIVGAGPVDKPTANAMTVAIDANGDVVTTAGGHVSSPVAACRISVGPKGQALIGDPLAQTLAHEVFHCYQLQFAGPVKYDTDDPAQWDWLYEGSAESVGCDIVPQAGDLSTGAYTTYLQDPLVPLFKRAEPAVGFYQHVQDEGIDVWPRWPLLFSEPTPDAAYQALVQPSEDTIWATYAPGFLRDPSRGGVWDARGSCIPPNVGATAGIMAVSENSPPIKVTVGDFEGALWEPTSNTGAVGVAVAKGFGRFSGAGGTPDDQLGEGAYCIRSGGCDCPDGVGGDIKLPQATVPRFALSAAKGGGEAFAVAIPIDELCKRKGQPDDGGGGYSNGDPHLRTFDGLPYEFQAAGEFVLARSSDGSFEVQARQQPYVPLKTISVNTAIALRAGAHRVVVHLGNPTPRTSVDGAAVDPAAAPVDLGSGIKLRGGAKGIRVTWPDGTTATVQEAGIWGLIVSVDPGADLRGRLDGLLGTFDGNTQNDLHVRGTTRHVGDHNFGLLYGSFERSWLIRRGTSMFDYPRGRTSRSYYIRGFPKRPASLKTLSSSQRKAASSACRSAGVTAPPFFDGCVLDVGLTGKSDFATGTADLQATLRENVQGASVPHVTATPWQAITSVGMEGFQNAPALTALGPDRALMAWAQQTNVGTVPGEFALQSLDFTASPSAAAADIHAATIVSGWGGVDPSPALWSPSPGATAVIWAGDRTTNGSDPFFNRTAISTRQSDGSWSAPTAVAPGDYPDPSATALQGGDPFFVRETAAGGDLLGYRGINLSQTGVSLDDAGTAAYGPQLARDGAGSLWLAWRAPAPNDKLGIWIRPLDPATGAALGPSVMAPGSDRGGDILSDRVAIACNPTGPGCRVAYPSSDGTSILTWSPGDAAPATAATGTVNPLQLRAAYSSDGRLWLFWFNDANDDQSFRVIHGDATGAGTPEVLDPPPTQANHIDLGETSLLPINGGLLVVGNLAVDGPRVMWATFVSS